MKKIFLTILMIFAIPLTALGEELYPFGSGKQETKETHPIYFGYMEDYAALLREAFEKKKMFKMRGWGSEYYFTITRDGTIKDMSISIWQNDYFDKKEVKPFSIFDNYSPLYISIFMDVEKIDDNGNKYYLIRNEFSDYYIDSKTGLVIKITDISQSSISDLYYVFGTVENNDINRPDV